MTDAGAPRLSAARWADREMKTSDHFSSGWLRGSVCFGEDGSFEGCGRFGIRARAGVPLSGAAIGYERRSGGCGHRGDSDHVGVRFEAAGLLGQRRAAGGGAAIGSPSLVRYLGRLGHRARFDRSGEVIALGCRQPVAIAPLGGLVETRRTREPLTRARLIREAV